MLQSVIGGQVLTEMNTSLFVNGELENYYYYAVLLFKTKERPGIFHEVCI
jgi:hypothetical protein